MKAFPLTFTYLCFILCSGFSQSKIYYGGGLLSSYNGISFEQNWELTLHTNKTFVYKIRKRSFGGDMLKSNIETIKGTWAQNEKNLTLNATEFLRMACFTLNKIV